MNVPSLAFFAFAAVAAVLLAFSAGERWRRGVFVVFNLAFLASFAQGPASLVPFAAFLACGFLAVRAMVRAPSRVSFVVSLVVLIAGFCWLKRYAFVPSQALLPQLYVTVGLSYSFFRVIGLVVDAYQKMLPAPVTVAGYLNYTLNFTSFVSGPVELYRPFYENEIERPARLDRAIARDSAERLILGCFKVTVVSPLLALAQQRAIEMAAVPLDAPARVLDAASIAAIYPIFLYVNFSGYTDVVIAAARFLRLELPENFDKPFASRGYLEYWTRWHMSLSNWFKTYVYSPFLLGLMRRFPSRNVEAALGVVAYFVTFFLIGLWHGQTTAFVVLGILMGAGASVNKLFQLWMTRRLGRQAFAAMGKRPVLAALSCGLTFAWVAFTLVFFWGSAGQLLHLTAVAGTANVVAAFALIFVAAASYYLVAILSEAARARLIGALGNLRVLARPAWYAAIATIVVSVAVIFNAPAPHLIYKAF